MKNADHVTSRIKEKKLRLTGLRKGLLEYLLSLDEPQDFDELSSALKKRGIAHHRATLYRELATLEKHGLLSVVDFGDGRARYEAEKDTHHHHLICLHCSRGEDIPIDESLLLKVIEKESKKKNFLLQKHTLEFFGVCATCRS